MADRPKYRMIGLGNCNLELSSTAATSKEGIMEILKEDYPRSDLSVGLKHAILVGQVAVGHSHIATEWIAEMT